MAKVDYTPYTNISPTGAPDDYQRIESSPADFGGLIGEAAQRAGAHIEQGLQTLQSSIAFKQDMTNELYANDASTEGMKNLSQVWGQYNTLEGRAAHDAWPDYQKQIQDTYQQTIDAAPNPQAKEYLSRSMKQMTDRYLQSGQQYADTAWKQWYTQSANSRGNELSNQAVIARQDPKAFDMLVHAGVDEAMKPLDATGADPTQRDAATRAFVGTTVKNAVDSFVLENKLGSAVTMLQQYSGKMDANNRIAVERVLAPKIKEVNAQSAADWAANPVGPKPSMIQMPSVETDDASSVQPMSGGGETRNVLLKAIAHGESGGGPKGDGDYDSVFGDGRYGHPDKPVTQLTINQAIDWADRIRRNPDNQAAGNNAGPLGRYQFVGSTIRSLRDQMGLSGNEQFTPAMQDRLAWQNLKNTDGDPAKIRSQWVSWAGKSDAEIHRLWDEGFAQHKQFNGDGTGETIAAPGAITSSDLSPLSTEMHRGRFTSYAQNSLTPDQAQSMADHGQSVPPMAVQPLAGDNAAASGTSPQVDGKIVDPDAANETNDESAAVRRVLDLTAGNADVQRAALAQLKQKFSVQRAATATDRMALEQQIPDLMKATEDGVDNVPWPDNNKIRSLLPAAKANQIIGERDIAQHTGDIVSGMRWSSTEDWMDMLQDIGSGHGVVSTMMKAHAKYATTGFGAVGADPNASPDDTAYYRMKEALGQRVQAQFMNRQKMLNGPDSDPAAYVNDNPRIAELRSQIDPKNPATIEAYATKLLGVESYLGVPDGNLHVLTRGTAQSLAEKIMQPGTDAKEALDQLRQQYGGAYQHVFKDLITIGGLPSGYQSIGTIGDNDPHAAALLSRAYSDMRPGSDGKPKNWKETIGEEGDKAINTAIDGDATISQFRKSLTNSSAGQKDKVDSIMESVKTLAYARSYYDGVDPADAAGYAIKSFTNKYDFSMPGGPRVPASVSDVVKQNAAITLQAISPDNITIPPAVYGQQGPATIHGQLTGTTPKQYIADLRASYNWVTSPNGDGIWLKDGQNRLVRGKDGRPLAIPFNRPAPAVGPPGSAVTPDESKTLLYQGTANGG